MDNYIWEETELRLFYVRVQDKRIMGTLSVAGWDKAHGPTIQSYTCKRTGISFLDKPEAKHFIERNVR